MDEKYHSDMCRGGGGGGGVSVEEVAHEKCRGEGGGGILMDDTYANTSGLGREGILRRKGGGSVNGVAFGDACDSK